MGSGRGALILSLLMLLVPFTTIPVIADEGRNNDWIREESPASPEKMALSVWQPSLASVMWDVAWSPGYVRDAKGTDISRDIAAVGLDGTLSVWNNSDGRVVMRVDHHMQLLGVDWLDESHVITLDQRHNWDVYTLFDDGSARPSDLIEHRSGHWSSNMTGIEQNWGHDMEVSANGTRVVFCGGRPASGGEIVVVDTAYLLGLSTEKNSISLQTPDIVKVCRWSEDGASIATIERSSGGDSIRVYDSVSLEQTTLHNIATGSSGWHLDWKGSSQYSVAWTKSSGESVVSHFIEDGQLEWYTPLEESVTRIAWSTLTDSLYVGLLNEGQVLKLDAAGEIVEKKGWHAYRSSRSDIRALDIDASGNQMASVGQDGTVVIWSMAEFRGYPAHDSSIMREFEISPSEILVAIAKGSGSLSIKDIKSGKEIQSCVHPNWGDSSQDVPYVKSVKWLVDDNLEKAVIGYTDGLIQWCPIADSEENFDTQTLGAFEIFGRLAVKDKDTLVITSVVDGSDSLTGGKVRVLTRTDTQVWEVANTWDCDNTCWVMEFNRDGTLLATAEQTGKIRIWQTSEASPSDWIELESPHSHGNYTGVVEWSPRSNLLLSVGWDKRVVLFDIDGGSEVWSRSISFEGFSAGFSLGEPEVIIGSGMASDSSEGEILVYDANNGSLIDSWSTEGIPRGVAITGIALNKRYIAANSTGEWTVWMQDTDGDGQPDSVDLWPEDPSQWADSDGDGYGDNENGSDGDLCPTISGRSIHDRLGCLDSDSDGWSDADQDWPPHPIGIADAFDEDPSQWNDSDSDSYGDNYFFDIVDELRVNQSGDAFVDDSSQWSDIDGDGCGDNHSWSLNGLWRVDIGDAFPSNSHQCNDQDGDSYGDNYSFTIGDDGLRLEMGDAFPQNPLAWSDLDGDGCPPDSIDVSEIDNYPEDASVCQGDPEPSLPENLDIFVTSDTTQWRVKISWHSRGANTEMIEVFIIELNESIDCDELCIGNASLSFNPAPAGYVEELRYIERSGPTRLIIVVRSTNLQYSTTIEQWTNHSGEELPEEIKNETGNPPSPAPEENNSENDSNSSSQIEVKSGKSDNSLLVWGGAAGLVLLIGAATLLLKRRDSEEISLLDDSASPELSPISQPVCTRCGGTTQVVAHQGHDFHWCGACQQYNT